MFKNACLSSPFSIYRYNGRGSTYTYVFFNCRKTLSWLWTLKAFAGYATVYICNNTTCWVQFQGLLFCRWYVPTSYIHFIQKLLYTLVCWSFLKFLQKNDFLVFFYFILVWGIDLCRHIPIFVRKISKGKG